MRPLGTLAACGMLPVFGQTSFVLPMCKKDAGPFPVLGPRSQWSRECLLPPPPDVFEGVSRIADATRLLVGGREQEARRVFAAVGHLEAQRWYDEHAQNAGNQRAIQLGRLASGIPSQAPSPARRGLEVPSDTAWAVYARDAFTCRYCAVPTIHANVRSVLRVLLPHVVPWGSANRDRHGILLAAWTQCDHPLPWSQAGSAEPANPVTSCGACQWGKQQWTLEQVGLETPLRRPPSASGCRGLTECIPALQEGLRARGLAVPRMKTC